MIEQCNQNVPVLCDHTGCTEGMISLQELAEEAKE